MTPTLKEIIRPSGLSRFFVVSVNGRELGLIQKLKPRPQEEHPWKAFLGIGDRCQFLDAFYGREGKNKAINAILVASKI